MGDGEDVRYIDVKGHVSTGDIVLYYTGWHMAHRIREEFFNYEVNHALTQLELWITQAPVGKWIAPTERIVEYDVAATQLKGVAQSAELRQGVQRNE